MCILCADDDDDDRIAPRSVYLSLARGLLSILCSRCSLLFSLRSPSVCLCLLLSLACERAQASCGKIDEYTERSGEKRRDALAKCRQQGQHERRETVQSIVSASKLQTASKYINKIYTSYYSCTSHPCARGGWGSKQSRSIHIESRVSCSARDKRYLFCSNFKTKEGGGGAHCTRDTVVVVEGRREGGTKTRNHRRCVFCSPLSRH